MEFNIVYADLVTVVTVLLCSITYYGTLYVYLGLELTLFFVLTTCAHHSELESFH